MAVQLKAGQIDEKEMMRITGASKFTLSRWRRMGLPYKKRGKYIVYQREEAVSWTRQKILSIVMNTQASAVTEFEKRFRQWGAAGKAAMVSGMNQLVPPGEDGSDTPEEKSEARMLYEKLEHFSVLHHQSIALRMLAMSLQWTSAKYALSIQSTPLEEAYENMVISAENKAFAKQIMLTIFPAVTEDDAEQMVSMMDTAYKNFVSYDTNPAHAFNDLLKIAGRG